jgi:lipopolysaccharide/colanic/teichoic acid biosynthesis glycosyltransferase
MSVDGGIGDAARPLEIVASADAMSYTAADALGHVEPAIRSERLDRIVNVGLAAIAMVLLAPLYLLLALAVRLTSRGPILYTQTRVGLDRRRNRIDALYDRRMQDLGGHIFTIYKFRTMYVDAEAASGAIWAKPGDPRVTPLGRVMRKLRLDELPQLYNVLKGDMNIVGPAPRAPEHLRPPAREHHGVPAPPAGQARDHRLGADQPGLRLRPGRRAGEGPLRPGVPPAPEPGRGLQDHAADRAGRDLPAGRVVAGVSR